MRDMRDLPDEKLHVGHRARMRRKFLSYGPRIFDTYELLEMLLYHVIPYKDTNPIAKRLLMEFGSLEGVEVQYWINPQTGCIQYCLWRK